MAYCSSTWALVKSLHWSAPIYSFMSAEKVLDSEFIFINIHVVLYSTL